MEAVGVDEAGSVAERLVQVDTGDALLLGHGLDRGGEGLDAAVEPGVGMVASVTHNARGRINFPYEYARVLHKDGPCNKRLSFCCTLLTPQLLKAYSFEMLDPEKNWYDVYISHLSQKVGLLNILQISNPVLHKPHSSRPWKKLKYTRPLLYYWQKMVLKRDRI